MMILNTIDYHTPLPLTSKQSTYFYYYAANYAAKQPKLLHKRKMHSFAHHNIISNSSSHDTHTHVLEDNVIPLEKDITVTFDTESNFKSTLDLYHHPNNNWFQKHIFKFILLSLVFISKILINPNYAEAAGKSGGRMGGSNFGGFRSSSYSSSSRNNYSGSKSSRQPNVLYNTFFYPMGGYGFGYGGFGGGSSFFSLIFIAMAFVLIANFANRFLNASDEDYEDEYDERISIIKVQVGLLGLARRLQMDLDQLGRSADTSGPSGLHYILQETILSLKRNPDYCIYGASEMLKGRDPEKAERKFNEISLDERSKFREETLLNIGGRKRESSTPLTSIGENMRNEYIVVTLLVAAQGSVDIPQITSREDLTVSLNRLGSIRSDDVMAVEVLWTPQDEKDTYSKDELTNDYPSLFLL